MGRGNLIHDENGNVIQKAAGFTTEDGAGTPEQSPVDVSSSEVELEVPDYAAEIQISTDQSIWIDNVTGVGSSQGYKLVGGLDIVLPVEPGDSVFLIRDSADAKVSFIFKNLKTTA